MKYQIENDYLKIGILSEGAELCSIIRKRDSRKMLHERDGEWGESSPILFPFIGRFQDGKYKMDNSELETEIHGFIRHRDFNLVEADGNSIELSYTTTEEDPYPGRFKISVRYCISNCSLTACFSIDNLEDSSIWVALGLHPGFTPVSVEHSFIEFENDDIEEYMMNSDCLWSGRTRPSQKKLDIRHASFNNDAIILGGKVFPLTYRNPDGSPVVTIRTDDFKFLTIWHRPYTEHHYVCIEPCMSIPGRTGVIEHLEDMPGYRKIEPFGTIKANLEMIFPR